MKKKKITSKDLEIRDSVNYSINDPQAKDDEKTKDTVCGCVNTTRCASWDCGPVDTIDCTIQTGIYCNSVQLECYTQFCNNTNLCTDETKECNETIIGDDCGIIHSSEPETCTLDCETLPETTDNCNVNPETSSE